MLVVEDHEVRTRKVKPVAWAQPISTAQTVNLPFIDTAVLGHVLAPARVTMWRASADGSAEGDRPWGELYGRWHIDGVVGTDYRGGAVLRVGDREAVLTAIPDSGRRHAFRVQLGDRAYTVRYSGSSTIATTREASGAHPPGRCSLRALTAVHGWGWAGSMSDVIDGDDACAFMLLCVQDTSSFHRTLATRLNDFLARVTPGPADEHPMTAAAMWQMDGPHRQNPALVRDLSARWWRDPWSGTDYGSDKVTDGHT